MFFNLTEALAYFLEDAPGPGEEKRFKILAFQMNAPQDTGVGGVGARCLVASPWGFALHKGPDLEFTRKRCQLGPPL